MHTKDQKNTQCIKIYDTTLRDGSQAEEISFSVEDKLRIAKKLDELGVHYIEGGWPLANPKDTEFFKKVKSLGLKNSKVSAFGSTRRHGYDVKDDPYVDALLRSDAQVVTIVGKSWDLHVTDALNISLEENLDLVTDTIFFLKKEGREVLFDAEHFFDGYKRNPEYAMNVLTSAEEAGADIIVLCDTNGGTMSYEVTDIVEKVKNRLSAAIGIHAHNDTDTAVANSIAAVIKGAAHVQGTINGFGERCGNANLCSVIPNLILKMHMPCISSEQLKKLKDVSRFINELANMRHLPHQPYVGKSAFAHKGGIHVSAIKKNRETYEHTKPEYVGNHRRILVSELSGKSNIIYKAEEYGLDIKKGGRETDIILSRLKRLEQEGFLFEGAEGSFELLMKDAMGLKRKFFTLIGFRLIVEKRKEGEPSISEAAIKLIVDGVTEHTVAEGNGPVNALDNALRKALEKFYPEIGETTLLDYKVRILDESSGTKAKTRVLIETGDHKSKWGTVGVSDNIIEASWQALVDSIDFKLNKCREKGGFAINGPRVK